MNYFLNYFVETLIETVNYAGNRLTFKVDDKVYQPEDLPINELYSNDIIDIVVCGWTVASISVFTIKQFNKTSLKAYSDLLSTFAYVAELKG